MTREGLSLRGLSAENVAQKISKFPALYVDITICDICRRNSVYDHMNSIGIRISFNVSGQVEVYGVQVSGNEVRRSDILFTLDGGFGGDTKEIMKKLILVLL